MRKLRLKYDQVLSNDPYCPFQLAFCKTLITCNPLPCLLFFLLLNISSFSHLPRCYRHGGPRLGLPQLVFVETWLEQRGLQPLHAGPRGAVGSTAGWLPERALLRDCGRQSAQVTGWLLDHFWVLESKGPKRVGTTRARCPLLFLAPKPCNI